MGKKKEEVVAASTPDADEDEDTPVIKQLKGIDDKFCSIEVELEKEIQNLRIKYSERQAPLVEERRKVLNDTAGASEEDKLLGTPGVPDFWLTAMNNCPDLEQCVHDCDEEVLKYVQDIQKTFLDASEEKKGMRFELTFRKNPFFTNEMLWFEVHNDYDAATYKPYKEPTCIEQKACAIDWTKNITVEKKAKESNAKKGGKKKPAKAKEEPVPSFFSIFFTNIKKDDPLPDSLQCVYEEMAEEEEMDDITELHLGMLTQTACAFAEDFLPYALRYFTGEAGEDDDDDDEESEEEDDDDEDDDDSDEEPAPKKGGKKKPAAAEGAAGQKTEECKQQ